MTPLDEFVARWQAGMMPIPFVEVVNSQVDLDDLPDEWASAILQSEGRRDVTMGEGPWVEETGTIVVGMFARAGSGRSGLDEAAAMLRETFHGYTSEDQSISFSAVVGPEDVDPEADGEWWRVGFTVPYVVQDRRVEPADLAEVRIALEVLTLMAQTILLQTNNR